MSGEIILAAWSVAGLTWWIIALRLVSKASRQRPIEVRDFPQTTLSIFKPLPPLGADGLRLVAPGLESFAAQLDPASEMLLGVHEADRDFAAPFLKRLRADHPHARIKVIHRAEPDDVPNPKIAWQKFLASHAEGEFWLWSDADIVVPAGFLQAIRGEHARTGARMMTFPYVVRELPAPPSLLEALFVNVEFYPGVLLLRQRGPVDFGFGAATLFRRDDFLAEVDWRELGSRLADDFYLGQKLRPVVIGQSTVVTVASAHGWSYAFAHDIRWAKTIRWNRPLGAFSRILVLPVAGWLVATAMHPLEFFRWIGLLGMIQADVLFAALICRRAGCRLSGIELLRMELWSPWRVALWILTWLPVPVRWAGTRWRGQRDAEMVKSG